MIRGSEEHQKLATQVNEIRTQAQQFVWWFADSYGDSSDIPEPILVEVGELIHRIGVFMHNIDPSRDDWYRML